jgi:hypothetical protein
MERERPGVMVPASEETVAMGILVDQFRRMQGTMDKVNDTLVAAMQQLSRMDAEAKAMVERRNFNEKRLDAHEKQITECEAKNNARFLRVEGRVDDLEDWKIKVDEGRAVVGGLMKHPLFLYILGWVLALATVVYTLIDQGAAK